MANKRQVVFEFRDILYDNLIPRFGENFALKDVLYQLAAMGLIPPKTLRKFIIQNKGHVGHTFIDISVKYDISEKQAKNIVYKQRSKFNANSNIRQDSSLR